ncbi:MAG: hypothetical protein O7D91_13505 [Planctomycetota bacterium]|nr:hypothetical protein [Planctomycetota bacterium]
MLSITVLSEEWWRLMKWVEVVHRDAFQYVAPVSHAYSSATCARGTILSATRDQILACIMDPDNRTIIYTLVPIVKGCGDDHALFALDMPLGLMKVLRRKSDHLTLELTGTRLVVRLPGPGKKQASFPMQWVDGHMMSPAPNRSESETLSVDAADLLDALRMVQPQIGFGCWSIFGLSTSPEGTALWMHTRNFTTCKLLTTSSPVSGDIQFCCHRKYTTRLADIVRHMARSSPQLRIRVEPSSLMLSNDKDCVYLFSSVPEDRTPSLDLPIRAVGANHLALTMEQSAWGLDRKSGQTMRQLLTRQDKYCVPLIRWALTTDECEIGIRNSMVEWPLAASCRGTTSGTCADSLAVDIERKCTAALLGGIATIPSKFPVVVRCDGRWLTVESPRSGFQMVARVMETITGNKQRCDRNSAQVQTGGTS